jgi:hypothetical protein
MRNIFILRFALCVLRLLIGRLLYAVVCFTLTIEGVYK